MTMWECAYGSEPVDVKLLVLRFLKKIWIVLLAAVLGVLLVGGPYFLKKVVFGPAKEYQAVTDFYIDYALQETGEQYTYFNQTTWTQLITDDVFTDVILELLREDPAGREVSKEQLREMLYATMLSDTRIVTTTVTTNDPELTMVINEALIQAVGSFGEQQKEISGVSILQQPERAELVIADVRTFRACMLGLVIFVFFTLLGMWLYLISDDSIYVPLTFERRFHIPMPGTDRSEDLYQKLARILKSGDEEPEDWEPEDEKPEDNRQAIYLLGDPEVGGKLADGLKTGTGKEIVLLPAGKLCEAVPKGACAILLVRAAAHNGRQIEEILSECTTYGIRVSAAVLCGADEKLVKAYRSEVHPFFAALHGAKQGNSADDFDRKSRK